MRSNLITFIAVAILGLPAAFASAQDAKTAKTLIKEGIALNDSGKYTQAVEKYTEALKADPNDLQADYEMGFTLYNEGKGLDAIPFLEKITQSNDSKYDDSKQPDKAIDCYIKGIADNPKYERLHFNLGISYLRQKKYTEAEESEIEAIKLDPKHASAQQQYGLAAYYNNHKAAAVLAFCNFLLLEPQSKRSATVYGYIMKIFENEAKQKNLVLSVGKGSNGISAMSMANMSVTMAAATKTELAKKNADSVENLSTVLKIMFEALGRQAQDTATKKDFFWNFYADYFYKLAESGNVPAFARYISLTAYRDENLTWFKENKKQLNDLDLWVHSTARSF